MSDPVFTFSEYTLAQDVLRSIEQDLAVHFLIQGEDWKRDTMQKHVNDRSALIRAQSLILDQIERVFSNQLPEKGAGE